MLGLQRRFIALQNIELTIHKGESVGVIGRNGSGKSTLLGLVAGVLKPSQGQVIVRAPVTPMLELGCGFHPDLSGKENAVLNAVLLGQSYARARQKVDAIIDFAELGEYAEEPVRTYSAGMLARLGFSIIAHTEPEILLIDEVLAVGDQRLPREVLSAHRGFPSTGNDDPLRHPLRRRTAQNLRTGHLDRSAQDRDGWSTGACAASIYSLVKAFDCVHSPNHHHAVTRLCAV
ncbi:MAG: ABC transporter ATP-binding protein [Planctomycetota bacterium]|nr:ABC transporter ATP-binding protein [Planctomycetota bacterium]